MQCSLFAFDKYRDDDAMVHAVKRARRREEKGVRLSAAEILGTVLRGEIDRGSVVSGLV